MTAAGSSETAMSEKEANGIRKFLLGIAAAVVGSAILQAATLIYWIGGASVRIARNETDIAGVVRAIKDCCP